MKKTFVFIVFLCFVFVISGCNSSPRTSESIASSISSAVSSSSENPSSTLESFNVDSFIDDTLKSLTDRNGNLISDPSGNCARIKAEIETRIKVLFETTITLQYDDSQYVEKAHTTIHFFKGSDFSFSISVNDNNCLEDILILAGSSDPSDDFLKVVTATLMLSDLGLSDEEVDQISTELSEKGRASTDAFIFYLRTDGSANFEVIPLNIDR